MHELSTATPAETKMTPRARVGHCLARTAAARTTPPSLTDEQLDRARGVLLGTATGDALGAGYEFTTPAPTTVIDMIGGGVFRWEPGEWTDDTAMTIAVAEAAATTGNLHKRNGLNAVAKGFLLWYSTGPKDVGGQTRTVLIQRPRSAAAMRRRAGTIPGRRGGNGSLMRTAPIALAYLDDAPRCALAAARVSALTHRDHRATEACILWSLAIRHAVLHGTYDGLYHALSAVDTQFWREALLVAENGGPADFPKNGWVVHALQTAWWAITHSDDLPGALTLAVRAGNDTDTTTAIAGGLLGARWGATAVPARWRAMLHGYPGYTAADHDHLAERVLVQALLGIGMTGSIASRRR
ncbi:MULTISPECIES: ADP-ribosylglycohydrolase family protein [Nocardia]|uniref:ADP-ribosylglycohydrolase family protein n=1 Tax=Nocardia TaxID=1817 RepID=UPI001E393A88|nr:MULTISPECIES: ADP-ribosylglycohydrolase family protein [Nocardia]